jgi:hypothetical protein
MGKYKLKQQVKMEMWNVNGTYCKSQGKEPRTSNI